MPLCGRRSENNFVFLNWDPSQKEGNTEFFIPLFHFSFLRAIAS
jgi:hypothetical protein